MIYAITSKYSNSNRKALSNFISEHPEGCFFQSPEIHELFNMTEKNEPITFIVYNERKVIQGSLIAVIQKEYDNIFGFFTARTIVWGGPLVRGDDSAKNSEIVDILIKSLVKKVQKKTIYIQFRNLFDQSEYLHQFKENGFKFFERLNYIVKIDHPESVRRRCSKSKIRQIKSSLKMGATITEAANIQQVLEFYEILKELYNSKVKKPLPPESFFVKFYEETKVNRSGTYLLIQYNGRIIGGIMCPITNGKTIYEWYVCGLDRKFKGVYPSVLATWASIEYALNNGLKFFDFMGAGKPDEDYGVREFKSKFGGTLVQYGRFERVNHKILYFFGKLGIHLLKKL